MVIDELTITGIISLVGFAALVLFICKARGCGKNKDG
jgi:hypothetical protein